MNKISSREYLNELCKGHFFILGNTKTTDQKALESMVKKQNLSAEFVMGAKQYAYNIRDKKALVFFNSAHDKEYQEKKIHDDMIYTTYHNGINYFFCYYPEEKMMAIKCAIA